MNKEPEYQVRTAWVNSKVSSNFVMTSIFIPLSVGIFLAYFSVAKEIPDSKWVFFIASLVLVGFWRLYAHYIDDKIIKQYPRICRLERDLEYRFTREYLKSIWWSDMQEDKLPTIQEIEDKIKGLKWYQKCTTRGHQWLNGFALIIIVFEGLVLFFFEIPPSTSGIIYLN